MMAALPDTPFILFDDARVQGAVPGRLYRDPIEIIETNDPVEVPNLLHRLDEGNWAGFLAYEAGAAIELKIGKTQRSPGLPLLWFARFDGFDVLDEESLDALLPTADGAWIGRPMPDSVYGDYASAFAKIENYITAGDIYQANLTFPCTVSTAGDPRALYSGLRARARAGYGGIVWTGEHWLLSLSPELFFAVHDGKITTKPMKGTATRRKSAEADTAAIEQLRTDPKQRAENLMIVDLLRNDLSRVAERGSVEVPDLFKVETYPTVHQMISTVTGHLKESAKPSDILSAIFPCGSITGAPKIRAMEVIHEVEPHPRGVYTGSIGRIDTNGDAAFNVAIRTIHLRDGETVGRLGLGSGVVADSRMEEEWRECLAKGRFVADPRNFDLVETMRFEPDAGLFELDRHLARMKESARAFDFEFDRHGARNDLQAATFRLTEKRRVRLMLARSGTISIQVTPLHPTPDGPVQVALVPLPVDPKDFRLRHKTTDRGFYGSARKSAGTYEVGLVDPDGFITEGSFSNIFVKRDGRYVTPPLSRGLLPGVLRAAMIENGSAVEADIRAEDLAGGFFIGNASRGLIEATLV